MNYYYRFVVENKGIYEVVDMNCPKTDVRRKQKPDGSWLAKVGKKYSRAISFWTEHGLQRYISSGLMLWHTSVVKGEVQVIIIEEPKKILYRDNNQIIIASEDAVIKRKQSLKEFYKSHKTI